MPKLGFMPPGFSHLEWVSTPEHSALEPSVLWREPDTSVVNHVAYFGCFLQDKMNHI